MSQCIRSTEPGSSRKDIFPEGFSKEGTKVSWTGLENEGSSLKKSK